MKLNREQVTEIIIVLDEIAREYNRMEYGLPIHDLGQMALMREALREVIEPFSQPKAPE